MLAWACVHVPWYDCLDAYQVLLSETKDACAAARSAGVPATSVELLLQQALKKGTTGAGQWLDADTLRTLAGVRELVKS